MIALIAGAVFAETSVSGGVEVRMKLYDAEIGDHGKDYGGSFPRPKAGGDLSAQIQLSAANDDGTLNGLFRLRNDDIVRSDPWFHRVFINWKPDPIINIFMGIDQDGKFATDALQGWSFHQGLDDYLHFQWWDFWRACFPGNWDGFGLALSLYPAPGIDINLVVPFGANGWPQATDVKIKKTSEITDIYTSGYRLQANISIPDVGQIKFSYKGPYNNNHFQFYKDVYQDMTFTGKKNEKGESNSAYGAVGLSFYTNSLVDGLQFNVGFATDNIVSDYTKDSEGKSLKDEKTGITPSMKLPMYFGAGVFYASDEFGVKFRAGAVINNAYEDGAMFITGNVMPWYNLGVCSVFLDIGMSLDKANSKADMENGFWVNPYVKIPITGGYFQTGFSLRKHINGHGNVSVVTDDDYMRVDFPIILGINF